MTNVVMVSVDDRLSSMIDFCSADFVVFLFHSSENAFSDFL